MTQASVYLMKPQVFVFQCGKIPLLSHILRVMPVQQDRAVLNNRVLTSVVDSTPVQHPQTNLDLRMRVAGSLSLFFSGTLRKGSLLIIRVEMNYWLRVKQPGSASMWIFTSSR